MIEVGKVGELWRYPVKSMEGTPITESFISKSGMLGDRSWAIKDETVGELSTVRKIPKLLKYKATYDQEPSPGNVPHVTIELPDGSFVNSADDNVDKKATKNQPKTL